VWTTTCSVQVDDYLFSYIGLSVCGRPEDLVAPGDVLDHPGVWEDARDSCVALLPPPDTHTHTHHRRAYEDSCTVHERGGSVWTYT
jgi:hypothetical protein